MTTEDMCVCVCVCLFVWGGGGGREGGREEERGDSELIFKPFPHLPTSI